jgi:hypothetical protein
LKPGRVTLDAQFPNGRTVSRSVTTGAGETTRIELEMPSAPPSAPVHATTPRLASSHAPIKSAERTQGRRRGVPVVVPWLTGAATLACGGITAWAALDTRRRHDEYLQHPTRDGWNEGVSRQRLTNVLAASTAALGIATVTLAFFVRGPSQPSVDVSSMLGPGSASMAVTSQF